MRFSIHALAAALGLALVAQGIPAMLASERLDLRSLARGVNSALIRRSLLSIPRRDLDTDGTGFLSPNESSITAACYPVSISFHTASPPQNMTVNFAKDGALYYEDITSWSIEENPWVSVDDPIDFEWPSLDLGPGTLAVLAVNDYEGNVTVSDPFTVQPSDVTACYDDATTGDAEFGGLTGPGITTTYAAGETNTSPPELPTSTDAGSPGYGEPTDAARVGFAAATSSARPAVQLIMGKGTGLFAGVLLVLLGGTLLIV